MSRDGRNYETFSNSVTRVKIMITYQRQKEILTHLKKCGFSTVKELAAVVFSSESSVRRDLKKLEQRGLIKQTYGGVALWEKDSGVVPFDIRNNIHSIEKENLAKRAAKYIFDGATVILDGSSTVRRILKYVGKDKKITVITNNPEIFREYSSSSFEMYCTGGLFSHRGNVFVGSQAEDFIRSINADLCFFSSQALSDDGIISDSSREETSLRRVMLSRSAKKIFLCDSSKTGLTRTFVLCSSDEVDVVLCEGENKKND